MIIIYTIDIIYDRIRYIFFYDIIFQNCIYTYINLLYCVPTVNNKSTYTRLSKEYGSQVVSKFRLFKFLVQTIWQECFQF